MKTDFREMVEDLRDGVAHEDSFEVAERAIALLGALGPLEGDELDVVGLVVERLQLGRQVYGQLDILTDTRDWRREGRDEALDLLIYESIGAIKEIAMGSPSAREGVAAVSAPRASLPLGGREHAGEMYEG